MTLFASKIKRHRSRLGYTQQDAAGVLGVSLRTYGSWESGENAPTEIETIGALKLLEEAKPKISK